MGIGSTRGLPVFVRLGIGAYVHARRAPMQMRARAEMVLTLSDDMD